MAERFIRSEQGGISTISIGSNAAEVQTVECALGMGKAVGSIPTGSSKTCGAVALFSKGKASISPCSSTVEYFTCNERVIVQFYARAQISSQLTPMETPVISTSAMDLAQLPSETRLFQLISSCQKTHEWHTRETDDGVVVFECQECPFKRVLDNKEEQYVREHGYETPEVF